MDAAALDALLGSSAAEREESWRYSRNALRALTQGALAPAPQGSAPLPQLLARADWEVTRGRRLVFVNGVVAAAQCDVSALGAHVDVEHTGTQTRIVLHAGARGPLHLVYVAQPGDSATVWQAHLDVEVHGTAVDLVEHHVGAGAADVLGALHAAFTLHERAALRLLLLSDLDAPVSLIRRQRTHVGADAALDASVALFGGRLQRADIACELAASGARCGLRGVFVPAGREHVDVQLDLRHAARETVSDVLWRGVADGRGRAILRGAITVAAGADGADAKLATKNLLLSPHAEIDAQPVLEIHADEVKASHGATVGELDPRALFYLRSRGVPAAAARALLIAGFCREALSAVAPDFAADVDALLDARLPHTGADA